jgi:hypothetical protein
MYATGDEQFPTLAMAVTENGPILSRIEVPRSSCGLLKVSCNYERLPQSLPVEEEGILLCSNIRYLHSTVIPR